MDAMLAVAAVGGLVIGVISGLIGIGGGALIVPMLVYGFGLSQQKAQGTSLAVLIPPIGLLAVLQYYRAGNVDVKLAVIIALAMLVGGYFGGQWATELPPAYLRKGFALLLVAIAAKMFFQDA